MSRMTSGWPQKVLPTLTLVGRHSNPYNSERIQVKSWSGQGGAYLFSLNNKFSFDGQVS